MKTGDILLVHSNSLMARIIQKFQQQRDKKAGYYNHSGIIYQADSGFYVVEEAEIAGRKFKASVVFTPIDEYLKSDRELLLLEAKHQMTRDDLANFEKIMFHFVGIPYDYGNLLIHQIVRLLKGKWIGKNKTKAWKKMVCHEFTQTVWDEYAGIFPDRHMAKVSDIYRSSIFKHRQLKGIEKLAISNFNTAQSRPPARMAAFLNKKRPVKHD